MEFNSTDEPASALFTVSLSITPVLASKSTFNKAPAAPFSTAFKLSTVTISPTLPFCKSKIPEFEYKLSVLKVPFCPTFTVPPFKYKFAKSEVALNSVVPALLSIEPPVTEELNKTLPVSPLEFTFIVPEFCIEVLLNTIFLS